MDLIWTKAAQRVNCFLSNVHLSNKEVKTENTQAGNSMKLYSISFVLYG